MTRRRFGAAFAAAVLGIGALVVVGGPALGRTAGATPPSGPSLDVIVFVASKTDAGASLDPALHDLPTGSPPFNGFSTFKVVSRTQLPLEVGKEVSSPLPNGHVHRAKLTQVVVEKGEKRYHLDTHIGDPAKPAFVQVTVSETVPFYVGEQTTPAGQIFVELKVQP